MENTSEQIAISLRTLFRWHNNITPCSTRQKPATKLDMDKLAKDVENYPDDYQCMQRLYVYAKVGPAATATITGMLEVE